MIQNYQPVQSDELQLLENDFIYMAPEEHEHSSDGWYKGTSHQTGVSALFPGNFTVRCSQMEMWTLHRYHCCLFLSGFLLCLTFDTLYFLFSTRQCCCTIEFLSPWQFLYYIAAALYFQFVYFQIIPTLNSSSVLDIQIIATFDTLYFQLCSRRQLLHYTFGSFPDSYYIMLSVVLDYCYIILLVFSLRQMLHYTFSSVVPGSFFSFFPIITALYFMLCSLSDSFYIYFRLVCSFRQLLYYAFICSLLLDICYIMLCYSHIDICYITLSFVLTRHLL